MAKHDEAEGEEDSPTQSRSQQRGEARAYSELAEYLAKGKPSNLPNPPFEGELLQAVKDARRFEKNARSRQLRRLASLMRQAGPVQEILDAINGRTSPMRAQQARERICEDWRARLIENGDEALSEFLAEYPTADRTRMRQLMRQANRIPAGARSKKAATTLLREIRVVYTATLDAAAGEPDDESET